MYFPHIINHFQVKKEIISVEWLTVNIFKNKENEKVYK